MHAIPLSENLHSQDESFHLLTPVWIDRPHLWLPWLLCHIQPLIMLQIICFPEKILMIRTCPWYCFCEWAEILYWWSFLPSCLRTICLRLMCESHGLSMLWWNEAPQTPEGGLMQKSALDKAQDRDWLPYGLPALCVAKASSCIESTIALGDADTTLFFFIYPLVPFQ